MKQTALQAVHNDRQAHPEMSESTTCATSLQLVRARRSALRIRIDQAGSDCDGILDRLCCSVGWLCDTKLQPETRSSAMHLLVNHRNKFRTISRHHVSASWKSRIGQILQKRMQRHRPTSLRGPLALGESLFCYTVKPPLADIILLALDNASTKYLAVLSRLLHDNVLRVVGHP